MGFESEAALPWLLGVATNVLRNRRRSHWRYRAALQRLPHERVPDFPADADERVDDERRLGAVLRSVARLPKREPLAGACPDAGTRRRQRT